MSRIKSIIGALLTTSILVAQSPTKKPVRECEGGSLYNGRYYRCSPEGRWVNDIEHEQWILKQMMRRADLAYALSRRKLTHAELTDVTISQNVQDGVSYSACVKHAELYEDLRDQYALQTGTEWPEARFLKTTRDQYGRCQYEDDNRLACERILKAIKKVSR